MVEPEVQRSKPEDVALVIDGGTLRDWFAAHAPAEVPFWFEHQKPAREVSPMPDPKDYLVSDGDLTAARSWVKDPNWDLEESHPVAREFVAAVKMHREQVKAWKSADYAARFFQWRWAYANSMLAERSKAGAA